MWFGTRLLEALKLIFFYCQSFQPSSAAEIQHASNGRDNSAFWLESANWFWLISLSHFFLFEYL